MMFPLVLALLTSASAVRPPETTRLGAEPPTAAPWSGHAQTRLEQTAAWEAFVAEHGDGWQLRADGRSGAPAWLWGPGIDLQSADAPAAQADAALAFARRHAGLLGVADADVRVRSAAASPATGLTYVDLAVLLDGAEVLRGGLTFRFRDGLLVAVGVATWPDAARRSPATASTGASGGTAAGVSERAAIAAALAGGPAPGVPHLGVTVRPVWVPSAVGKPTLTLAWEVRSESERPRGRWRTWVDATTGRVMAWVNDLRFLDGAVELEAEVRAGTGQTEPHPFAEVYVTAGSELATTAADGTFTLDSAGPFDLLFQGPGIDLDDDGGSTRVRVPPDGRVTADDVPGGQAALTTWHWLQAARDFGATLDATVPWIATQNAVTVNIDDLCNAFFDGTLNFFREGGGCRNTGRLPDVIFHEWGHGFHAFSLLSGDFDGDIGEGVADVFAALHSRSPEIAPTFFLRGGALRVLDNDNRYPDDIRLGDVHGNGLIFGGAMWDLWQNLAEGRSLDDVQPEVARLLAGMLKAGPTIPRALEEIVLVDDDDADPTNGTPNLCAIVDAFGQHGLGPAGGQGIQPVHAVIESLGAADARTIDASLPDPAPGCFELTARDARIRYQVDGGPWQVGPLDVEDADVRGQLPELPLGSFVAYILEVDTAQGTTLTDPVDGDIRPHTFYVGDVLTVSCDDFEDARPHGWRGELLAGTDTEGAMDWQLGTPVGWGGDPAGCFSGRQCWGNDLGGGNFNGQYQNEKTTSLRSPELSTYHYDGVFLRYRRWLSVEDGFFDEARILADDAVVWTNHATDRDNGGEHHQDDRWAAHAVPLDLAPDARSVTLRWELRSDQGLTFGGWTLDDVCLHAPDTPDNRLGMSDLAVARDGRDASVTFTGPRHGPIEEVRLVRKRGGLPSGPDDGEIAEQWTDVEPDTALTASLSGLPGGRIGFAVYAFDGEQLLSWTREGYNAQLTTASGAAPGGCGGCAVGAGPTSSGGVGGGAAGAVTALLLTLARRRR